MYFCNLTPNSDLLYLGHIGKGFEMRVIWLWPSESQYEALFHLFWKFMSNLYITIFPSLHFAIVGLCGSLSQLNRCSQLFIALMQLLPLYLAGIPFNQGLCTSPQLVVGKHFLIYVSELCWMVSLFYSHVGLFVTKSGRHMSSNLVFLKISFRVSRKALKGILYRSHIHEHMRLFETNLLQLIVCIVRGWHFKIFNIVWKSSFICIMCCGRFKILMGNYWNIWG